jgi:putative FmdB family regulatory protein
MRATRTDSPALYLEGLMGPLLVIGACEPARSVSKSTYNSTMPILEYSCRTCGHQFEFLKLPTTAAVARCPACQGEDLERLLSIFAMSSLQLTKARVKAARKQRLASKEYKDKQVAEAEELDHHNE